MVSDEIGLPKGAIEAPFSVLYPVKTYLLPGKEHVAALKKHLSAVTTEAEMRDYLVEHEGVEFLPNTNRYSIRSTEASERMRLTLGLPESDYTPRLKDYLQGSCVVDRFGINHDGPDSRRAWEEDFETAGENIGGLFRQTVVDGNPLQVSYIFGSALGGMGLIIRAINKSLVDYSPISADISEHALVALDKIGKISQVIRDYLDQDNPDSYHSMPLDEKLDFVERVKQDIVTVLSTMGYEVTQEDTDQKDMEESV